MQSQSRWRSCIEACPPVRNRYFYGKLLDVVHFQLEQDYFNQKRWMQNRLVTGSGVVCGLGVRLIEGTRNVVVLPGLAIDCCGREIVVCEPSQPVQLPAPPQPADTPNQRGGPNQLRDQSYENKGDRQRDHDRDRDRDRDRDSDEDRDRDEECGKHAHIAICYHECQSDPVPTMGGDCDDHGMCAPGSIRESYRIEVKEGRAPHGPDYSRLRDVFSDGQLDYGELVKRISEPCAPLEYCCIPLANIRIPERGGYTAGNIHIDVRPIVFTNRLLYELILAYTNRQGQDESRWR